MSIYYSIDKINSSAIRLYNEECDKKITIPIGIISDIKIPILGKNDFYFLDIRILRSIEVYFYLSDKKTSLNLNIDMYYENYVYLKKIKERINNKSEVNYEIKL